LVKGSGGHRLGGWDLRKIAPLLAEAACEAGTQAAERRPAGQRPSTDEAERLQRPAQAVRPGRERMERHLGGRRPSSGGEEEREGRAASGRQPGQRQTRHESRAAVGGASPRGRPWGARWAVAAAVCRKNAPIEGRL